jgi:hypothetical protein
VPAAGPGEGAGLIIGPEDSGSGRMLAKTTIITKITKTPNKNPLIPTFHGHGPVGTGTGGVGAAAADIYYNKTKI